jgi:hypothetical protein
MPVRDLHKAFHEFAPVEFKFLVTIQGCMTLSRRRTNDAIWEIPTTESLTTLHNILQTSNKIMSPFCGIALYEKLLTNLDHDIITVDNFSSHETSNQEARQMPVEDISFEDALGKYPEVDTLLCIWTPGGVDILKMIKDHLNIKKVIFVGEPVLCGCWTDDNEFGYFHEGFTCQDMEDSGGLCSTDHMFNLDSFYIGHSMIYVVTRD